MYPVLAMNKKFVFLALWAFVSLTFASHLKIYDDERVALLQQTSDQKQIATILSAIGVRFEQWVFDTCFRPYDQDWLNYQHEIALRHTSLKKNTTDGVDSTPYVPLRDIIAFIAVMNETIKPYLSAKGHTVEDVEQMNRAWTKSLQLQIALWARPYTNSEW